MNDKDLNMNDIGDIRGLKEALEKEIAAQKALLTRCEEIAASVPGRLTARKDGSVTVLVHVWKDPLTGRTRSRQLGKSDALLKKRLWQAALCRKMIPLLVYNIKEAEKLAEKLRPLDIAGLTASLPGPYRQIEADLSCFGADDRFHRL